MEFASKSFHVIMKFLAMELYVFQDGRKGRLINVRSQSLENVFDVIEIQVLNCLRLWARVMNSKGVIRIVLIGGGEGERKIYVDDKSARKYTRYFKRRERLIACF